MMKSMMTALALTAAVAITPAAKAATPITYYGTQQIGAIKATYTIQTDGTIGQKLTEANLIDYTFELTSAQYQASFTKANGFTVGEFSATALSLQSLTSSGMMFQRAKPLVNGVRPVGFGDFVVFGDTYSDASIEYNGGANGLRGNVTFANNAGFASTTSPIMTAVPEPATWAMMIVGFAIVGAASRYRRRGTAVTFA